MKTIQWFRKFLAGTAVTTFLLAGCSSFSELESSAYSPTGPDKADWVIYWYLCGSDLESENGAATLDLEELQQAQLPDNVKVVIETGGSSVWDNDMVPHDRITRFIYDNEGFHEVESLPNANMGDAATLEDFLRFGQENFRAEHNAFIFWDHGGGSLGGVCVDENYEDTLSLNEIHQAFSHVFAQDTAQPAFDVVGFDACLMATIDNASNLHGFARYMVASEETEPGSGWDYTAWTGALGKDSSMDGRAFGKVLCDTYLAHCEAFDEGETATLSVVDLSKTPQLLTAYNEVGMEALTAAQSSPQSFFTNFARGAKKAENYGGNTREQGYLNMVDLGSFVQNNLALLPNSGNAFLQTLQEAVVYKVQGPYRKKGMGLSGYYSYDGDLENLEVFQNIEAASPVYKRLYARLLGSSYGDLPVQPLNFDIASLEDVPVHLGEDGYARVQLTPEAVDGVSEVRFQLVYFDLEDELIISMGSDSNLDADWEQGIFTDNFTGEWPCLNGNLVYMEIVESGEDYNLYSIPINLNGVDCNLQAVYDFSRGEYRILGARRENENGISDRNLLQLKVGDKVATRHYACGIEPEDEFEEFQMDAFTLDSPPVLRDELMGDGQFGYMFEFVDPRNESAGSEMIIFEVKNDEIFLYDSL